MILNFIQCLFKSVLLAVTFISLTTSNDKNLRSQAKRQLPYLNMVIICIYLNELDLIMLITYFHLNMNL